MQKRKIVYCDDEAPNGTNAQYGHLRGLLSKDGHEVDHFNARDEDGIPLTTDGRALSGLINDRIKASACDGLIVDLVWFPDIVPNNTLGLDALEFLVSAGIRIPLSLDRIVLLTRFSSDPVVKRFVALNCPRCNIFDKSSLGSKRDELRAIFT